MAPFRKLSMADYGLVPVVYRLDGSMNLVPCLKWGDRDDPRSGERPVKMTIPERISYMRSRGGYMADCDGDPDSKYVWALPMPQ